MLDSIKSLESSSPTPEPPAVPSALDKADPQAQSATQIIGIGASAGGPEACSSFLDTLPTNTGMTFILVQHLDPDHESLMVSLLTAHTSLVVLEAAEGMSIERDHLYIIPPASFLTVDADVLHLKPAPAHRGARLPFDILLQSMAKAYGARATCIVMSGTGGDGSVGLHAIKAAGGLVIAQEPREAGYDGMPRSAIATGAVDAVLTVAAMPAALAQWGQLAAPRRRKPLDVAAPDPSLTEIIDLLRTRTNHDFTLYKQGTLRRRVERRMAIASIEMDDMEKYVTSLRSDPAELEHFAKDLLIHVTSFFRDPAVFEELARTIVPELIRSHPPEHTLRIWVAGCSTGEEAYSVAMVFHEHIVADNSGMKLQILASDADPDAISCARDGVYPLTIETDVSPARLAAYFTKVNDSYRILPELRATIVFTVQNLLADPPFSRLDFVSCRNVLIYLGPEAQRKVEDDPQVSDLLALLLADAGHRTCVVPDGPAAMDLVERGTVRPDLLLTDYNLPRGMDGLAVAAGLRARIGASLPVITLTGDILTRALHGIAGQHCLQLSKPVKPAELMRAIQELLTDPAVEAGRSVTLPRPAAHRGEGTHAIFIADDDCNIRDTVRMLLEDEGHRFQDFETGEAFLAAYTPGSDGCLLIDAYLPGMSGLQLLQQIRSTGDALPTIMITGSSDVAMAVFAMKAGAADFIEKPIAALDLIASIDRALERSRDSCKLPALARLALAASANDGADPAAKPPSSPQQGTVTNGEARWP